MGNYNVNTLRNIPTNRHTDEFNDMMAEHHLYPMVNYGYGQYSIYCR